MADLILPRQWGPTADVIPLPRTDGLFRFTTAGSVDDGKSTLIGRLLYDTQTVYEDQVDSVRKSRINRSTGPLDFSLLTDGLRAEREQGITIDVAYRYFSTPRRKFIIADTPGHEQYTRNMVTGASTADAAVVLIDATRGLLPQSRRHAYIANLLGIRHLIFAVNKMDMVGYDQAVFRRIESAAQGLAGRLGLPDACVVPVSALEGDNVARRSRRMDWFSGPSLLELLEVLPAAEQRRDDSPLRLPIQYVIRPNASFRGFAGRIAAGTLSPGDAVLALPSGLQTRIRSIVSYDGDRQSATAGESITVTLDDEIDLGRGDLLVSPQAAPAVSRRVRATLVWMHAEPLDRNRFYLLKHTTRMVRARIAKLLHRIDVETFATTPAETLSLNDIASAEVEAMLPLWFDPYRFNRTMGSFILIDPISNATVAGGMIERSVAAEQKLSSHPKPVSAAERQARFGHRAAAVWIEGEPRLAEQLERALFDEGWLVQLISTSDFRPSELLTVAKAMGLAGALTIFAASAAGKAQSTAVAALFEHTFFLGGPSGTGDLEGLLSELRSWRSSLDSQNPRKEIESD